MSELLRCPSCQQALRIPAGHSGKQVRCPKCSTAVNSGPQPVAAPIPTTSPRALRAVWVPTLMPPLLPLATLMLGVLQGWPRSRLALEVILWSLFSLALTGLAVFLLQRQGWTLSRRARGGALVPAVGALIWAVVLVASS